ncbi:1,4-dihydroxy-2-naphthoate octaprenyltransferase [Alteribacillus iranensis]|uniref:1,4-dihydroxy-2-naphthoate octaprenyltransferase n=1 Tax=Alteribacillus iranensis TaxID=930128 RepID=A0A1I2E632_9BACI|nr:1,4-dihydroxy-2-naphthoate octaprenyltransferase [Alteribacillus iranensis]SFE88086.1 1,4-dihydroxy-2-naphthoate prenyltransferase [Alteribacillus iranensis]
MPSIRSNKFIYRHSWKQLVRPLTLTGTVTPVLAGTGFAFQKGSIDIITFLTFLIALLLIQVSVNICNDYYDFQHGQDKEKWTSSNQIYSIQGISPNKMKAAAILLLFIALLIGLRLAFLTSPWLIIVGILGMTAGIFYSAGPRPLASFGMGELTASIFLGVLPFTIAYSIQGHGPGLDVFTISLTFAFLIATMILTNNIRDIKKDKPFRVTIPIKLGKQLSVVLLSILLTVTYALVFTGIFLRIIPVLSLLVILAIPLAIRLVWSFRPNNSREHEIQAMKIAAYHHWMFGLLLAGGIWFGAVLF